MSTSWTRNAGSVCSEGLHHLGLLPRGQTANPEDMQAALGALNAVLKELPLYGYAWPKLSADVALTWESSTPSTVALPDDYYGYPVVRADNVPIAEIKHPDWIKLVDRTQTGTAPTGFYISPANELFLFPVPTQDPSLTLQYQVIASDVSASSAVDVPQWMLNALGWGVAYELLIDSGLPPGRATQVEARWKEKKAMVLANAISGQPINHSVDDDRVPWSPENWQDGGAPLPDLFDANLP